MSTPDLVKLRKLERLVSIAEAIRQGTQYAQALASAVDAVKPLGTATERLSHSKRALEAIGDSFPSLPRQELRDAFASIETAAGLLESAVSTAELRDVRFPVAEITSALRTVETGLCRSWKLRVDEEFGGLAEVGSILTEIPETKAAGRRLRDWAESACEAGAVQQLSEINPEGFARTASQVASQVAALETLGIDRSVRLFLLTVARHSATLMDLTPDVLNWLKGKSADGRFRVQFLSGAIR